MSLIVRCVGTKAAALTRIEKVQILCVWKPVPSSPMKYAVDLCGWGRRRSPARLDGLVVLFFSLCSLFSLWSFNFVLVLVLVHLRPPMKFSTVQTDKFGVKFIFIFPFVLTLNKLWVRSLSSPFGQWHKLERN